MKLAQDPLELPVFDRRESFKLRIHALVKKAEESGAISKESPGEIIIRTERWLEIWRFSDSTKHPFEPHDLRHNSGYDENYIEIRDMYGELVFGDDSH